MRDNALVINIFDLHLWKVCAHIIVYSYWGMSSIQLNKIKDLFKF